MTKKGLLLAAIIIVGELLFGFMISLLPVQSEVDGVLEQMHLVAPLRLLAAIILPIIFITQFHHKPIYKYLAMFLVGLGILRFFTTYTFDSNIYYILSFILSLIAFIVFFVFVVFAFSKEGLLVLGVYLAILLVINIYSNTLVSSFIANSEMSLGNQNILMVVVPVILTLLRHVASIVVVMYECKELSRENEVLI